MYAGRLDYWIDEYIFFVPAKLNGIIIKGV